MNVIGYVGKELIVFWIAYTRQPKTTSWNLAHYKMPIGWSKEIEEYWKTLKLIWTPSYILAIARSYQQ